MLGSWSRGTGEFPDSFNGGNKNTDRGRSHHQERNLRGRSFRKVICCLDLKLLIYPYICKHFVRIEISLKSLILRVGWDIRPYKCHCRSDYLKKTWGRKLSKVGDALQKGGGRRGGGGHIEVLGKVGTYYTYNHLTTSVVPSISYKV